MHGFCAIGLLLFLNKLIALWIGESFIFSDIVVLAIVLHFYISGAHFPAYIYRVTMGLFVQGRWAPLAASFLNIILSFWLGSKIGIGGIFLATSISRLLTTGIVDPILIYREGFGKTPVLYYLRYFAFTGLFVGLYFLMKYAISLITVTGLVGLVVEVIAVSLFFNLVMVIIFWKHKDFIEIRKAVIGIVKRK